ncbi:MAG: mandelate racemase [Polaromonas sp.]|nr:mandelate racemase [Polaromonas sp.]
MKIIDIRETTVPIGSAMRNASIAFDGMTASALAIISDQRSDGEALVGYAFDSIGRYAKGGLLRERFIPRLLAAPSGQLLDADGCIDPRLCFGVMMAGEKQGGHGERSGAVGLLDAALWDLRAKQKRQPLWRTLSHDHGRTQTGDSVRTYASCGHFSAYPGAHDLRDEVAACIDAGYTTVKIKLGGRDAAEDANRIDSALASGLAPDRLAVDINGQWRTGDSDWLAMAGSYGLAWVEEPAPPLDYAALASFCAGYAGCVATGENLFSADDVRNLLRYGGLRPAQDRIQVDMLLSYGLSEYTTIMDDAARVGWAASAFWPHAGHLFAAHAVAAFGLGSHEAAPDERRLYGGFWDGVRPREGRVRLPDAPGTGYERKANLFHHLKSLL